MKQSQSDRILRYMEEHGGITALDAMREFRCMRLASRICDLKKRGVNIVKQMVKSVNSYGETVCFAEYNLGDDGNELGGPEEENE